MAVSSFAPPNSAISPIDLCTNGQHSQSRRQLFLLTDRFYSLDYHNPFEFSTISIKVPGLFVLKMNVQRKQDD